MDASTFLMYASCLLVVITNGEYTNGSGPFLRFYLNQGNTIFNIEIPANSYIYWTDSINFDTGDGASVVGASIFNEKNKRVLAPWSVIHGTFTEFAVFFDPTMFSFNGLSL